ncbi:S1C family serine protease [Streptomyces afghaniensis]|uniref:S1C family serine protease n=1 Tax=Streptomyces afghaniensis TaxID=66865 RepID=UPI002786E2B8|nr:trypsin-like peptidase domain-containing protein [Streptomyces afghaniensis]MDQ1016455.1 putative serine protease PepD [Streptomyces afghaniensis]
MNEGKPTKAKWWSRPRPQGLSGEPESTGQAPADSADTDGDFELARPAARQTEDGGDYELRRPEPVPAGGERVGAPARVPTEGAEDGVPVMSAVPPQGGPAGTPADTGSAVETRGVAVTGDAPSAVRVPSGSDASVAEAGSAATPAVPVPGGSAGSEAEIRGPVSVVPVDGGPKPLHDPDPYSTPPYGEPGPWAPAPPVQHPAATPAHGVVTADQPAVPGTSVAPSQGTPAVPPGTPAPAAPLPAPSAPAPVPGAAVYADTPSPAPVPGPWQRYDPWAAPVAPVAPGGHGPLQQNGAGVLSTEQRRRRGRKALLAGAVLLALVSGGVGGGIGTYLERNGGIGTVELPQAGKEPVGRDADSVAGIAGRALPSVVTLHVSGSGEQGTGTGFVLDTGGHILTNNHVVRAAGSTGEITVTFNGGETAEAELVGRDSGYDLAVVKVKGVRGLTPLALGNSDNVQVGDPVVAIGAPFDLAGTVTSGIISAKQRPITAGGEKGDGSDVSYVDALQTDAPINPGNSGGPLLDAKARVIGINSAIRSADSGSEPDGGQAGSIGLGFAIPINQGKRVAEELINTGKATHPVIGITLDMDYTGDGARVATEGSVGGPPVTVGGPGAKAGIKAGDVITEVDGQRVHSGEELIVKTRARRPGDRLELTVERAGKERTVALVLGSAGGS